MQANPLVSIVMPVYKVEKYIKNSVKSVIAQSYKNIEFILVDDGSPDKSVEIAEEVLSECSYPYKLIRQENSGIGEARNAGIKNAHGEWILFLDSDDIILPNAVKDLVEAIEDNTDIVFSGFDMILSQDEANKSIKRGKKEHLTSIQIQNGFLIRDYIILAAGTLFNRELLIKENVLFEKIPWSEDQHFVWRLLSFVRGAVFLDEPLYQYLKRPGSIMTASQSENILKSYPEICKLPEVLDGNRLVKRFLVARWVLGTISSAAKITDYSNWLLLYGKLDGKKHMKTLLRFPSVSAKIRAFICLISKRAYYNIFAKRI